MRHFLLISIILIASCLFVETKADEEFSQAKYPSELLKSPRALASTEEKIEPGYWADRSDEFVSKNTYYCFKNPRSCLGGTESQCAEGYSGTICGTCQQLGESYSQAVKDRCIGCSLGDFTDTLSKLGMVLISIVSLGFTLLLLLDSRNILSFGKDVSAKRLKICLVTNLVWMYFQDLYVIKAVYPTLPDSIIYLTQPISNPSQTIFGILACFAGYSGEVQVVILYIISTVLIIALVVTVLKFAFKLSTRQNTSFLILSGFYIGLLGFVDLLISLLDCQEIDEILYTRFDTAIVCTNSLMKSKSLLILVLICVLGAPFMVIYFILNAPVKDEDTQTRAKVLFLGLNEDLTSSRSVSSSALYAYINVFSRHFVMLALFVLKKRIGINSTFITIILIKGYFAAMLYRKFSEKILSLAELQSKLIKSEPIVLIVCLVLGKVLGSGSNILSSLMRLICTVAVYAYTTVVVALLIGNTNDQIAKNLKLDKFISTYMQGYTPAGDKNTDSETDLENDNDKKRKSELQAKEEMRGLYDEDNEKEEITYNEYKIEPENNMDEDLDDFEDYQTSK